MLSITHAKEGKFCFDVQGVPNQVVFVYAYLDIPHLYCVCLETDKDHYHMKVIGIHENYYDACASAYHYATEGHIPLRSYDQCDGAYRALCSTEVSGQYMDFADYYTENPAPNDEGWHKKEY